MFSNLRYKVVALLAALLLWGVSHTTSSIERGFDIPVLPENVPDALVVTDGSSDAVNVRVRGARGALQRLAVAELGYSVDLTGARAGRTQHDVDLSRLDLPRGAQIVSRSPASLEFTLERKSTRSVKVRADIDGEPAPGFMLGEVVVEPARLRIAGARSEVLRLSEVLTETIDVAGADAALEKKVRAMPGGLHVWLDGDELVAVRIAIVPVPVPEPEAPPPARPARKGKQR
jgi:YbbR domain-containing protein